MALTFTATNKAGASPASKQIGAIPAPTVAAPSQAAQGGPFAKWKAQKPADIPQGWWDQYWGEKEAKYASDPAYRAGVDQQLKNPNEAAIIGEAQQRWSAVPYAQKQQFAAATESKTQQAQILDQILGEAKSARQDNQGFIDNNVVPNLASQKVAASFASAGDNAALGMTDQARKAVQQQYNDIAKRSDATSNQFNNYSGDMWGDLQGSYNDLNASDQGAVSKYNQETDPLMGRATAGDYGANVAFDPEGLAAQRSALDAAIGTSGGALDYASQGAKSFADAGDVAAQRGALGDIQKDLKTGGAEQQAVLDHYKQLAASPQQTAQERFLMELARRQNESQTKSSRDAASDALRARGIRSGGSEIAAQQAYGSQLAQDRVLAEAAANAGAVQRQMAALQGQGTAANALRGSTQTDLGMQGDLSTSLRNASFDEAFKRGTSADSASANNQQTRLGGQQLQGSMANQLRDANDSVNKFNKEQSLIQQRYQDSYAQDEAKRVGDLANSRLLNTTNTNVNIGNRASDVSRQGQDMLDTNYKRTQDALKAATGAADTQYSTDTNYAGMFADTGQRAFDRTGVIANTANGVAQTRAGISSGGSANVMDALKLALGSYVTDDAKRIYGS